MSDNFVQKSSGTGTTTAAVTLNSVVAGNAIWAVFINGQNSAATLSVSDGQGAYTALNSSVSDATDNVTGQGFLLLNANAGTHTITGTTNSGQACEIHVMEIGTTAGLSALAGSNSASQTNPGTGANAVSSGSMTISAAATVAGFSTDSHSTNPTDEPAVGTGFTTRDNGASTTIGAFRHESGAFATNQAATFTAITGTDTFLTFGVAILNAAPPAGGLLSIPLTLIIV